jgi:hypothetical protein
MSRSKPIHRRTTGSGCCVRLRVSATLFGGLSALFGFFTAIAIPDGSVYFCVRSKRERVRISEPVVATGRDEIRKRYERLFAETPALHVQILHRLASGRTIIDQERVTGLSESKIRGGFAVYEVAEPSNPECYTDSRQLVQTTKRFRV